MKTRQSSPSQTFVTSTHAVFTHSSLCVPEYMNRAVNIEPTSLLRLGGGGGGGGGGIVL